MTRTELEKRVMKSVRKRESAAKREMHKYDLTDAKDRSKKKDKKRY